MLLKRFRALKKPDKEKEEALRNEIEEMGGLEKNDMFAMIMAGLLTIMPVAIGVLLLFVLVAFLIF